MTHIIIDIQDLTLEEKNRIKETLKTVYRDRIKIYNLEIEK